MTSRADGVHEQDGQYAQQGSRNPTPIVVREKYGIPRYRPHTLGEIFGERGIGHRVHQVHNADIDVNEQARLPEVVRMQISRRDHAYRGSDDTGFVSVIDKWSTETDAVQAYSQCQYDDARQQGEPNWTGEEGIVYRHRPHCCYLWVRGYEPDSCRNAR